MKKTNLMKDGFKQYAPAMLLSGAFLILAACGDAGPLMGGSPASSKSNQNPTYNGGSSSASGPDFTPSPDSGYSGHDGRYDDSRDGKYDDDSYGYENGERHDDDRYDD